MFKKFFLFILVAGILLTGCGTPEVAAPIISFTSPPDGVTLPGGAPVTITIASAESSGIGIVRVELYVNGEYFTTEASYSGAVPAFNTNIAWPPPTPGVYNLMAVAYAADDTASTPATLKLAITGEGFEEAVEAEEDAQNGGSEAPAQNIPAPTQGSDTNNPYCGDGICSTGEDCTSCPNDCGNCCGNGSCESGLGETCQSCETDCGPCCGNGLCDYGESFLTCIADCEVVQISYCGDGNCDEGEAWLSCPGDCPIQIITICGDGICNGDEGIFNCMEDCWVPEPVCGNGICEIELGESWTNCMQDCPQY